MSTCARRRELEDRRKELAACRKDFGAHQKEDEARRKELEARLKEEIMKLLLLKKRPTASLPTDVGNSYDDMMAMILLKYYFAQCEIDPVILITTFGTKEEQTSVATDLLASFGIVDMIAASSKAGPAHDVGHRAKFTLPQPADIFDMIYGGHIFTRAFQTETTFERVSDEARGVTAWNPFPSTSKAPSRVHHSGRLRMSRCSMTAGASWQQNPVTLKADASECTISDELRTTPLPINLAQDVDAKRPSFAEEIQRLECWSLLERLGSRGGAVARRTLAPVLSSSKWVLATGLLPISSAAPIGNYSGQPCPNATPYTSVSETDGEQTSPRSGKKAVLIFVVGSMACLGLAMVGKQFRTVRKALIPTMACSSIFFVMFRNDAAVAPEVCWIDLGLWASVTYAYVSMAKDHDSRVNVPHRFSSYMFATVISTAITVYAIASAQKSSLQEGLVTVLPLCFSFWAWACARVIC